MSGWKDWQQLEIVEEAEFQSFIQDQVIQVYLNSTARSSAIALPSTGMASFLTSTGQFQIFFNGSWQTVWTGS